MKSIILIPARMASTRLPNKPLAPIGGVPMVVRVMQYALQAGVGEVVVAAGDQEIVDAVTAAGGRAVLTDCDLPSGSDRIHQALQLLDPEKKYDIVINVQGDMPTLDPAILRHAVALMQNPQVDIATLAAEITDEAEKNNSAVVKVVVSHESSVAGEKKQKTGKALSFSRTYSSGAFHHIGIYVYRRAALEKFVSLPPSPLEQREKLEQLRAMEAGMRIEVAVVDTVPLGVDTLEGLERARSIIGENI